MDQRLAVLIDGADNAVWRDEEGERYLARLARPLGERIESGTGEANGSGPTRRVWTSRHDPRMAHPLLPPPPEGADQWPLEPLKPQAALDFFNELAVAYHVDYDPEIMSAHLPLWGGVPRWLANFARKAAESPERALLSGDLFLRTYVQDMTEGPSSRDLYGLLALDERSLIGADRWRSMAHGLDTHCSWHPDPDVLEQCHRQTLL